MTTSELVLTAGFDRNLVWAEGGSVRYLVAKLEVETAELQAHVERGPLNIALSIDASGSMSGGKLEAAKLASLGLLDRLNSRDRLTVVSFASDVVIHLKAVAMDDAGKRKARSAIGELSTRGMTNLSGGWFAAADAAAEAAERDASLTPRVVMLPAPQTHACSACPSAPARAGSTSGLPSPSPDIVLWAMSNGNPLRRGWVITQAKLAIKFHPKGDARRGRSLTLSVTMPHGCNLKDQTEHEQLIGEKYLRRWGVLVDDQSLFED